MHTRRYTDPVYLQYIWNAIEVPPTDRICDFDCILQFICNGRDPKCDVSKLREQLGNALRDKVIILEGSRYKKSDWASILPGAKHDSYCFQCHAPGPVVDCPTCFRVYHEGCFKLALESNTLGGFPDELYRDTNSSSQVSSCLICRRLANTHLSKETTPSDLRAIFSVIFEKMKNKIPWRTLYTVGYVEELNRNRYFSFKQMNTRIMTDKLRKGPSPEGYSNRTHILADLDLLIHNAAIIYGSKTEMTNTARHVRSLVQKELRESSLCVDCYLRTKGGKPDQKQIVEACRKPHKIIWFQYSSWSFRPCKVLYQADDGYEVACFDGRRERQFVPLSNAVAMTFSATHLGMRITAPLKRALFEARKYIENQQKVTPGFFAEEDLMLCDIPINSPESNPVEDNNRSKTSTTPPKVGSKRPRIHAKQKPSSQSRQFSTTNSINTEATLSKSRAFTPSSESCSTRQVSHVPFTHRLSNNIHTSSLIDSDDNSSISSCSSSTDSSNSAYPLSKRANYRSVAISISKKAVPSSHSSDSTTPSTAVGVTATASRSPLPRFAVASSNKSPSNMPIGTDGDSNSGSSPLESCSSRPDRRSSPSPIGLRRKFSSSSSTASSGTIVKAEPSLIRPKFASNATNKINKSKSSKITPSPKSRHSKDSVFTSSNLKTTTSTTRVNKTISDDKGLLVRSPTKKTDGVPVGALNAHPVAEGNPTTKHNPPASTTTPSVLSVSPAALSSSSGIGSSVNGDAKSVEASPADLQCNGHSGVIHADSTATKSKDRSQQSMSERLEALTLERDRANKRLRELEQRIIVMQQRHKEEILQTKKSAWCASCLKPAPYYCCAGIAYCSVSCQMKDWGMGHNQVCRHGNVSGPGK